MASDDHRVTEFELPRPSTTPVRFNPFSAEFRHNPYPMYHRIRQSKPVHRTLGMWVLTRHTDVQAVLRDRAFSAGLIPELIRRQADRVGQRDVSQVERLAQKSLVFTDNPEHARLRALVNKVFTPQSVAALLPHVTGIADRLLQTAWTDGGMDAITDFAAPLPTAVMSGWMALPEDLAARVGRWTHDIRFLLEPGLMNAEDFVHVCDVVQVFADALHTVVAERRHRPGEDLISHLLQVATAGGDRLTDEEVVFVCIMCFVAGNETTKALIGNALLALLRHPEQDALLRREPARAADAVTEALRYDSPLQQTKRVAIRDVEIADVPVRAGEQVLLCLAAANRDPAEFDRPDEFDLNRRPGRHLGFGHGMHGCLGGQLAELQARVALHCLYRRSESLRLETDDLQWQDHSFIVRGVKHLPLAVKGT